MTLTIRTGLGARRLVTVDLASPLIDGASVQLSIGNYDGPLFDWRTPDSISALEDLVIAGLYVGPGYLDPAAGTYYVWYRIASGVEIVIDPVRGQRFNVTAATGGDPGGDVRPDPLGGVLITNVPTATGQVLTVTSLSPLSATWQDAGSVGPDNLTVADNGDGTLTGTGDLTLLDGVVLSASPQIAVVNGVLNFAE
jgi:hypothetical protein